MARSTARKPKSRAGRPAAGGGAGPATNQDRVVAAFMALLAEKSFDRIELADVADRAGFSLADLRGEFSSTLAILAAHIKSTDRAVLAADTADMAEETPRERLFDVLMRRLDALAPHKAAIRSLQRSVMCNPGLAFAVNGLAVRSLQWMLTAADISSSGPKGMIRAQGLSLLFASVLRTWIDDDDPGQARTLAALDRALASGQRWAGFLDDLCRIPEAACSARRAFRRRPRRDERDQNTAAA